MRKDILKFGLKVLVCGDRNQLPPVKDNPAFLADGKIYHLTQCMRQQNAIDIYRIANLVSNGIEPLNGYYGNSLVIDHKDLTLDMLLWADAIVVGKNSTRDRINKMIRKALGYSGDMPNMGERVVCRSNEWDIALLLEDGYSISPVNGLICKVLSSPDVFSLNKDGTFTMTCQSMILPDAIFTNLDVNFGYINADYETRNAIKNNSKYHRGCLFEYAYCITAHIAQGSQFHKVVYIEEHMPRNIQNNINLVGASRADEALIYVKA
jgi:exodeoxyribonuclease-5